MVLTSVFGIFADFFEIAGEKQEVPKIVLRLVDIAVGDIFVHALLNRAAVHQRFQVLFCLVIRFGYHLTHNAVRRCVRPVWTW